MSTVTRQTLHAPRWMSRLLQVAGIYNIVWGSLVVAFPGLFFSLTGMAAPLYPALWQCIGMIVAVFGIGYVIAAADPYRHWPIILVGFLGKVFGPLGFVWALLTGGLPVAFGWTILTNDIIWWAPFAIILFRAASARQAAGAAEVSADLDPIELLRTTVTAHGSNVVTDSYSHPVLLVFLRHFGCTFCKETAAIIASQRTAIEANGTRIVMVHMSPQERGDTFFAEYSLNGVDHVSDPSRALYRAFGLKRGSLLRLFGPKVWWRGLVATLSGNKAGRLEGDGFQMPGAAVIYRGQLAELYRHSTAADRPDYLALTRCPACPPEAA